MRIAVASAGLVLSLFAGSAPATPAAASPARRLPPHLLSASTVTTDAALTERLHTAADDVRGMPSEPLFRRTAYMDHATRIATAAVNGTAVTPPGDDAPFAHVAGVAYESSLTATVDDAIARVADAATDVLRYPLHTDGGWSVVTVRRTDGRIGYGVALVVGWPAPAVTASRGCSTNGYCWSNSGLHPHLPWTRNTVKWYLSTSNLPSAGERLVKAAIAKVNAVNGLGAHVVYGGKTTATGPTSTRRFVVVFGSGCSAPGALGCTITSTQGSYRLIFQAKTIVMLSRYRANPDPTWWTGTLIHEIAHGTGLGHYDSRYNGGYQLMRSAGGPNSIRTGDANGFRRIGPGGRVSATLTPRRTLVGSYTLVVRTANSGLGGIRAIRTQCTDAAGTWQTVKLVTGTWDTRATDRTVGSFTPPGGATRSCRAIVRSKTGVVTTAGVRVG